MVGNCLRVTLKVLGNETLPFQNTESAVEWLYDHQADLGNRIESLSTLVETALGLLVNAQNHLDAAVISPYWVFR